jgi:hypothetical protein
MLVTVREPCVKVDNCDTTLRNEEELGRGWCFVVLCSGVRALLDAWEHSQRGVFTPDRVCRAATNEGT